MYHNIHCIVRFLFPTDLLNFRWFYVFLPELTFLSSANIIQDFCNYNLNLNSSTLPFPVFGNDEYNYMNITDDNIDTCTALCEQGLYHWSFLTAAANIMLEISGVNLNCNSEYAQLESFREECWACIPYVPCISYITPNDNCLFYCPYGNSSDILHILYKSSYYLTRKGVSQICDIRQTVIWIINYVGPNASDIDIKMKMKTPYNSALYYLFC